MTFFSTLITVSFVLRCILARDITTPSAEPPDFSGEDTPFNLSPFLGNPTSAFLYGYFGCQDFIGAQAKAQIDEAYYHAAIIANAPGVAKDIDFNTAAALEYLGAPGFNFDKQSEIQAVLSHAAEILFTFRNVSQQYIKVRCDDPGKRCENSVSATSFQANPTASPQARITHFAYANPSAGSEYPTINFCRAFFALPKLEDAIAKATRRGYPSKFNLELYNTRARVIFHEILHLYENANFPRPLDVQVDYLTPNGSVTQSAYGTQLSKILARWTGGPSLGGTGYWVQRNADNLAWYALAQYVTSINDGLYPNLPLVTYVNFDAPHLPADRRLIRFNNVNGRPVLASDGEGDLGSFWFDDNAGSCFDASDLANETDANYAVTIDDLVPDSAYPEGYQKSVSSWIASFTDHVSATARSTKVIPTVSATARTTKVVPTESTTVTRRSRKQSL